MVLQVTPNLASLKGLETQIIQKLKQSDKLILRRASQLVRANILADPTVFIRHAQMILIQMQGFYYDGGQIESEDPATFLEAGGQSTLQMMAEEVSKNLSSTLRVRPRGGGIDWTATIVSPEFIGFGGGEGGIPWIAFFVAGGLKSGKEGEDLLWITPQTASQLGWSNIDANLGRFGQGFLVVKTSKISKAFKARGMRVADYIHPISGKPGSDWFSDLPAKISNDPDFNRRYIAPAINQATQEVINKIVRRLTK